MIGIGAMIIALVAVPFWSLHAVEYWDCVETEIEDLVERGLR